MNTKLSWNIFWGKCFWCKKKIARSELKYSLQPKRSILVCSECRGEVGKSYILELTELEEKYIKDYILRIKLFAQGLKHIAKKFNKLIMKYNILAKKNGLSSIEHFDLSLRLNSDDYMTAGLSESKYSDTYCNLFELEKSYQEKINKYLIDFGKLNWNLLKIKNVFDTLLDEYNKLVDKFNLISQEEKKEKITEIDLLNNLTRQSNRILK